MDPKMAQEFGPQNGVQKWLHLHVEQHASKLYKIQENQKS